MCPDALKLRRLNLDNTKVTAVGIATLQKAGVHLHPDWMDDLEASVCRVWAKGRPKGSDVRRQSGQAYGWRRC